ncbi:uncharacterized protein C19orf44 homolog isoform X2 [Dunckerocampus dactyliophorus]|uniref:uncharacterized protein C19orf44 homolog isoform X2 n=1 Tax=Dunckerocampus dactyliophorus TaxID=161453 RepID=UPI0024058230|nr:uncharacterized protein C19orf44 homolog isoform X2 [Dunckerocampus dactyliophorus]
MWRRGGRSDALDRAQALLSSKRSSRAAAESTQTSATKTSTHADVKSRHAPPNINQVMSDMSDVSQVSSEPEVCGATRPGKKQEVEAQPQSPVGGGSRYLKKPPHPPSSQSPVRQQSHVDRLLSSSSSQTAALRRLAQIESRVHSRQRAPEPQPLNQIQSPSSDVGLSSLSHVPGAPVPSSSQPSSQEGLRFLKKNTTGSPEDLHKGVESKPAVALLQKDVESDEGDVRKLVGDALDPPDENWTSTSPRSRAELLTRSSLRSASPSPPPSGGGPSSSCSPSQGRPLSEARLLPSPSLQCSDSSRSAPEEVFSLEELFPVGCNADAPPSEASSVSSQSDFEINVMTLDDLNPAPFATEETARAQADVEHVVSLPLLPSDQWVEQVADYESDFESASRREAANDVSSSQVSEHLAGGEEEEDVGSEVKDHIDASRVRTEGDYSSTYSDFKKSHTLRTSGHSQRSPSSDSMFSVPPSNRLKDVAAQTEANALWFTGSAVGMDYTTPSMAPPTGTSEPEGLAAVQPDMLTLNDMLRQQLAMTRRFIESSRHQHASLLQSLGPPSYRYATLEDTMQYIRKHTHTK